MESLLAANPFAKGAFYDPTSTAHGGGHDGAESRTDDSSHLRASGFDVCTPLRAITRTAPSGGYSLVPSPPGNGKEIGAQFHQYRCSRAPFPLQRDTSKALGVGRSHPDA